MLKIALFLLATIDLGTARCGIEDNKAIRAFYGTYKVVYAWSVLSSYIPYCNLVQYKRFSYTYTAPYTCKCERNDTNLALVDRRSHYSGGPLLVDIVEVQEHVKPALEDNCDCSSHIDLTFAVFIKLNRNCFLHYEKFRDVPTGYLLCMKVPKTREIDILVKYVTELGDVKGQVICQNPKDEEELD